MKNLSRMGASLVLLLGPGLMMPVLAVEAPRWKDAQVVEDSIQKKIHQIVSAYDPRAVIFVNAQIRQSELTLPSTPFVYRGLSIFNEEQSIQLQKIDAKIYTEKAMLPEPVLAMLKLALKSYSVEPQIEVLPLPEELFRSEHVESRAGTEMANAWIHNRWVQILLVSLLLAFGLIPALSSFYNRRNNTQLVQHLESVIQRTIENFSESTNSSIGKSDPSVGQNLNRNSSVAGSSSQSISLSAEGFRSLLMDCYWNSLDSYATFVWQNTPIEIRGSLLSTAPGFVDYVRFFSDLEPVNLGYHDDPTYLRPLPISHLNQASVSRWAQTNTKHIQNLSRIRFEHLEISAKEKIRLLGATDTEDHGSAGLDASIFEKMPPSPSRQFQVAMPMAIKDVAEEKELLASVKGLSAQAKARVVSLGWLLEIPKENAQAILQNFTARDLASAWVGPEEVLVRLETYLPERKLRLLKDYIKTSEPSRKSRAFQAIHAQVVPHLKNSTQNSPRAVA